ncbi:PKD domain-containing protein [Pedobacter endophyticus]|uniref:PKD domain-containing protein n=1 Tax=Pedobacter endophyticus TaxID=2789740 RepID=A0A7S9KZ16_9SPHI|nr:PKD domain-containing protein [Pedobacter endophyticus]QPH39451.1 PKD domain-containing protein [Pedobacter endophyticus]
MKKETTFQQYPFRNGLAIFAIALLLIWAGCKKETVIESKAGFNYEIIDQNFTVPVRISFVNTSTGAQNYEWTFEGGSPASSNKKEPGIVQFDQAGTYKVKLRAWNDDNESVKEVTIQLDSAVTANFDAVIQTNDFSPVQVKVTNKTIGASTYKWTFEGGTPASSEIQQPPTVNFVDTGFHNITLTVGNGRATFTKTKKIHVAPALAPGFDIVPSFADNDMEAPLTATLQNTTISGLTYTWTTTGGTIANTTATSPSIHFNDAGTYTVTLSANNGKETKKVERSITVLPNKNLRTFTDIKLGVNTAHGTIGSFFSTSLRKTFKKGDDLSSNGKYIDIVYFGLNQNFAYNKFLSPDSAAAYTFNAIPQAMSNKVVNVQENCACGSIMTSADFEGITNGIAFKDYTINPSAAGKKQFTNAAVPRIVLYQTADGRKGAIKIKQYMANGSQSYIVIDIKVQKTP